MRSAYTQDHPFPHMEDILSYLNTGLYSLGSEEGAKESHVIAVQHQEELEINSKNEI